MSCSKPTAEAPPSITPAPATESVLVSSMRKVFDTYDHKLTSLQQEVSGLMSTLASVSHTQLLLMQRVRSLHFALWLNLIALLSLEVVVAFIAIGFSNSPWHQSSGVPTQQLSRPDAHTTAWPPILREQRTLPRY
jgi:hypothetical protein